MRLLALGLAPALALLAGCGDVEASLFPRADGLAAGGAAGDAGAGGAAAAAGEGGGGSPVGLLDAGVECRQSSDCASQCGATSDCERDLCDPARGRCVECVVDGHCEDPGEICSASLGRCAEPCATDADCSPEESCDVVVGVCVECQTDADCGFVEGERCRSSECIGGFTESP